MSGHRERILDVSGATMRCLLLGHHWHLESSKYVNPNRHDLGVTRVYYCARCLTRRSEKA